MFRNQRHLHGIHRCLVGTLTTERLASGTVGKGTERLKEDCVMRCWRSTVQLAVQGNGCGGDGTYAAMGIGGWIEEGGELTMNPWFQPVSVFFFSETKAHHLSPLCWLARTATLRRSYAPTWSVAWTCRTPWRWSWAGPFYLFHFFRFFLKLIFKNILKIVY
jgi:hypothetical protein